jgi:hypothetical protein
MSSYLSSHVMPSKLVLFGLVVFSLSACTTSNHVTQNTYSQATAIAEQNAPAARTAMVVPAQVSLPMTPQQVLRPAHQSGSFSNGAYFYRRYQ